MPHTIFGIFKIQLLLVINGSWDVFSLKVGFFENQLNVKPHGGLYWNQIITFNKGASQMLSDEQNYLLLFRNRSIVLSDFYSKVLGGMLGGAHDVGTDGI